VSLLFGFHASDLTPKNSTIHTEKLQKSDEGKGAFEMKKGKYTEEQIIEVLKRMEAGQKARDLARELGVSEATLYT
jgi:hypothetical protein